MKTIKHLIAMSAMLALIGCATMQSNSLIEKNKYKKSKCKYVERDLTANWDTRSYWCLPNGIRHVVQPVATAVTTEVDATDVNIIGEIK